jgi:subfamily B ATP-binding cassette protein MsbA
MNALLKWVPSAPYLGPLWRSQKPLLARFTATAVGRSASYVATIFLLENIFAGLLGEGTELARWMTVRFGQVPSLCLGVAALLACNLATSWCRYDNQIAQQRIVREFELSLMDRLIRHLLVFSSLFFQKNSPGDLLHALRQDVTSLRTSLRAGTTVFLDGVTCAGLVAALIWLSPELAFWALCVLPAGALPVLSIIRRIRLRSYAIRKTSFAFHDYLLQMIAGIRIIKAYQSEQREVDVTMSRARIHFEHTLEQIRLHALGSGLMELLTSLGLVLVIMVGSYQIMVGRLVWSELFAFLLALRGISGPLNSVYFGVLEIQKGAASVHRIRELLDTPFDLVDPPDGAPLPSAPTLITFENVSFSYGEAPVLRNVDLQIAAGESVAIVGPSGAGKSTLLNLITRFYDPTAGRVLYDGRDLREFRLSDVYSKVAIVSQEPCLFAATVRENIGWGRPEATSEEIEAAARAAFVHDEIVELAAGYDTPVGIGGRSLSRGQAQRINLARAFLKDAPILLLDEATSSLDVIAEKQVQLALERLMRGRTNIFVTHKLSEMQRADRIIVVDGDSCVAIGNHEELHRGFAAYRQMWEA